MPSFLTQLQGVDFFGVYLEIVWNVIEDDLPIILDAVREMTRVEGTEK